MAHRTITALYDTRAEAEAAHQRLREVGVPESAAMVEDASRAEADREHLAALPDEDRHAYEEGIRRGGFLVTVHADDSYDDEAIRVLEETPAFDLDERKDEWRSSGWSGYETQQENAGELAPSLSMPAASALTGAGSPPADEEASSVSTASPAISATIKGRKPQDAVAAAWLAGAEPVTEAPVVIAAATNEDAASEAGSANASAFPSSASAAISAAVARARREERSSARVRSYAHDRPAASTAASEVLPPALIVPLGAEGTPASDTAIPLAGREAEDGSRAFMSYGSIDDLGTGPAQPRTSSWWPSAVAAVLGLAAVAATLFTAARRRRRHPAPLPRKRSLVVADQEQQPAAPLVPSRSGTLRGEAAVPR